MQDNTRNYSINTWFHGNLVASDIKHNHYVNKILFCFRHSIKLVIQQFIYVPLTLHIHVLSKTHCKPLRYLFINNSGIV